MSETASLSQPFLSNAKVQLSPFIQTGEESAIAECFEGSGSFSRVLCGFLMSRQKLRSNYNQKVGGKRTLLDNSSSRIHRKKDTR